MDKSRQQFEEAIKQLSDPSEFESKLKRANNGLNYADQYVDLMWISWQASRESLEKERDQAIRHLILVFRQYANDDHLFMSAGENACEFLEDLGYGIDTGRNLELTDKGKQLIKEDWE
ncbi:hypothetical protein BG257_10350 [Proteus mirabilis]|uniref:hypothetical protein n=1 Tax=Proteus mirabilis TaxID=584 RepID=UPI0007A5F08E|nr:hypothetical protein [Proteus mirabilis]ATC74994.1 hypothetical protein BG257_10350 [Proteus mirabilis]ATC79840.1 hypothetical protein BG029_15880 [Proteus mirabilis]EHZ6744834.1 hypothetical protein [Proteus mirabilis]EKU0925079.1 hypothetical protein [Proteus mirabilis]EKV2746772.1 hypothetical protein [Proteus mirabilis]